MLFDHDTEAALAHAAALVNTEANDDPEVERPELLPNVAALVDFASEWEWTGPLRRTRAELDQVRDLRPRLRQIWQAPFEERIELINALLLEHRALPQLVRHGDYAWHIHAAEDDAPMHVRMAVEAAMALVDLVRAEETERLRNCAAEDCDRVLIDLSRNRSKIYCDVLCANKAHAAAYRARKASSDG